jgi:hypothetical protein
MRFPENWRRIAWTAALGATLCAAVAAWWWFHDSTHDRVFRMGYQYSPPGQLLDQQNQPSGAVPEAVREASNRTGIRLEWVFAPEGPDKAFAAHKVDLWPLMIQRPERRTQVYISEPYLRLTYWVVTREGFAVPTNWSGMRIARGFGAVAVVWMNAVMPGATSTVTKTQAEAMEAACRGDVQPSARLPQPTPRPDHVEPFGPLVGRRRRPPRSRRRPGSRRPARQYRRHDP